MAPTKTDARQDAIGKAIRLLADPDVKTDAGKAEQLAELLDVIDPAGEQPADTTQE